MGINLKLRNFPKSFDWSIFVFLFILGGMGFFGTLSGAYSFVDLQSFENDTVWQSSNPGAGGAFGVVGAGPTGVIIAGGDLVGAYRSLDRGESWDLIGSYRGLTSTHICGLGFDPLDASLIFIGAEHGLFRSADTGTSVTKVIDGGYFTDILVPATNDSVVYVAYHSKYNSTDGQVYKSTDNGLSWMQISADLPAGLHILELSVNPDKPDTLYLLSGTTDYCSGKRAAYRSNDGGIHWTQIGSSLGEVKDIKFDKSNPSTLYLSTFLVKPDDFGYLYRSEDDGNTWTELVHRTGIIWLDAADPGFLRLIELGYQYPNGSRSGVWASSDSGLNWDRYSDIGEDWDRGWSKDFHYGDSFNGEAKTFGEDMSDPNTIFWITSQWLFGSFDGGLSFQNLYTNEITPNTWQSRGINDAVLFDIEISPANSDIIYLGYFDLGFFRSLDKGLSWENCNHPVFTREWRGDGGSSYTIAADPSRQDVVWAAQGQDRTSTKVLLRSSRSGAADSWEQVGRGLPGTTSLLGLSVNPYSPESARKLFITANRNVYMSLDDGYNWSLALDSGGKCTSTAIDHFNGNLVYAGGLGGIWRSASGGAVNTWEPIGLPEMQGSVNGDFWDYGWTGVMDLETDPLNPNWIYAAVFGNGRGLFRSKDRGDSWEKILTDNYLRGVAVSPGNSQIIYTASSKPLNSGGYSVVSYGVQKSTDGGQKWAKVNDGLSWPFASAIEIDPENPDMVMIASPGEGYNFRNFGMGGPLRSNLQPKGSLASGTSSSIISLSTNEIANCRYSISPNIEFDEMENLFSTIDGTSHTSLITDLSDKNTYTFYCKCQDETGNSNPDDYQFTFRVGGDATNISGSHDLMKFSVTVNNLNYGGVNFFVNLPEPSDFMLKVYDITGRQLWTYNQEVANEGVHTINWTGTYQMGNAETGIFCIVLSSAKQKKVSSVLFLNESIPH